MSNKADDILVFGCGDSVEEAKKDHDVNLWNLMLRCCKVNLKLTQRNFSFKSSKLHGWAIYSAVVELRLIQMVFGPLWT